MTEGPVIVWTEHRGVFFGYATQADTIELRRARIATYFGIEVRAVERIGEALPDTDDAGFMGIT